MDTLEKERGELKLSPLQEKVKNKVIQLVRDEIDRSVHIGAYDEDGYAEDLLVKMDNIEKVLKAVEDEIVEIFRGSNMKVDEQAFPSFLESMIGEIEVTYGVWELPESDVETLEEPFRSGYKERDGFFIIEVTLFEVLNSSISHLNLERKIQDFIKAELESKS